MLPKPTTPTTGVTLPCLGVAGVQANFNAIHDKAYSQGGLYPAQVALLSATSDAWTYYRESQPTNAQARMDLLEQACWAFRTLEA